MNERKHARSSRVHWADGAQKSGHADFLRLVVVVVLLMMASSAFAQREHVGLCQKVTLTGEVNAGREWRQPIGNGWVLRMLPITPGKTGYTGWDLVMDRETGAGFPDALLLATPPYGSINEREIGTTYGLRAQDAIGWNPRSFRFLTNEAALREGQKLFAVAMKGPKSAEGEKAARRLMELAAQASEGRLRIEDARLVPGVADPAHFAESWAIRAMRMKHTEVPASAGKPTERGSIGWMRFSVTLWLPAGWKTPAEISSKRGSCQE